MPSSRGLQSLGVTDAKTLEGRSKRFAQDWQNHARLINAGQIWDARRRRRVDGCVIHDQTAPVFKSFSGMIVGPQTEGVEAIGQWACVPKSQFSSGDRRIACTDRLPGSRQVPWAIFEGVMVEVCSSGHALN